jgi:hypothetical protein
LGALHTDKQLRQGKDPDRAIRQYVMPPREQGEGAVRGEEKCQITIWKGERGWARSKAGIKAL